MEKLNSKLSILPAIDFLCAAKENESKIRDLVTDLIYPDTHKMASEGVTLAVNERAQIDIVRSMFDGRMAGIFSGTGGETTNYAHNEKKYREIITQGFPINVCTSALEMFGI